MKTIFINQIQDFFHNALESYCCIGFFDGVHIGHQKIIKQCVAKAKKDHKQAIVITFSDDCNFFLKKTTPLCQQEKKLEAFLQLGIEVVYIIKNSSAILNLKGEEFIFKIIHPLKVCRIFCGNDFTFGKDLKKGKDLNPFIPVEQIDDVLDQNQKISSSFIKQLFAQGKITQANQYLYFPFSLDSIVLHGKELGRTLDCKTANLQIKYPLYLKQGVYFGYAQYQNQTYKAMINVGTNPTIDHDQSQKIEVHLLNFNQDIYGQMLHVTFLYFHRPEMKFQNLAALKKQLKEDKISLAYGNWTLKG